MNDNKANKFDFEELIKDFRITDVEVLTLYLKDIWKDLSLRSADKNLGINRATFKEVFFSINALTLVL